MLTGKVRMDDNKLLLQESNLTARQPRRLSITLYLLLLFLLLLSHFFSFSSSNSTSSLCLYFLLVFFFLFFLIQTTIPTVLGYLSFMSYFPLILFLLHLLLHLVTFPIAFIISCMSSPACTHPSSSAFLSPSFPCSTLCRPHPFSLHNRRRGTPAVPSDPERLLEAKGSAVIERNLSKSANAKLTHISRGRVIGPVVGGCRPSTTGRVPDELSWLLDGPWIKSYSIQ